MTNNLLKIENKLNMLGITSKYGEMPIKEVEKFEETFGVTLSIEYKKFLQKFGALNFNDTDVAFYPEDTNDENPITIVNFYGLNGDNYDLKLNMNCYKNRIPDDLLPIAECPGGDQLCIGINNNAIGKIYYWNHNKEKLQLHSIEEMWEPVTLIFHSFYDLAMSARELEENTEFDNSIIEKIKVSDKFLARLKK